MQLTTTQLLQFGGRVGRANDAVSRISFAREEALNMLSRATRGGTDPDGIATAKELRSAFEGYFAAANHAAEWLRMVHEDAERYGLVDEAREAMFCPDEQKEATYWTRRAENIDRVIGDIKTAQTVAAEESEFGDLFGDKSLSEIKPARDAARKRLADIAAHWGKEVWDSLP